MKIVKKIILWFFILLSSILTCNSFANSSKAPTFESSFASKMTEWEERVFDIWWVSSKKTLKTNIESLFFPSDHGGWALWKVLRYAGMLLVFIYILYTAIQLITSMGKPDKLKESVTNLLFVLLWSFLFFWAMRIFSTVFNISWLQWTQGVADRLVADGSGIPTLPYFILSFLKWLAFFIAVIHIVIIWFQLMNPSTWESWNGKKIVKSLANVIFALVAIKVVDFLYYIASLQSFASQAGDFIIQIAKFLAYLSGIVIVFMIIYSWYLLVVDGWKWENFKKAKNTLINIVLAIIALFFFLFILYQIFSEFGGNS